MHFHKWHVVKDTGKTRYGVCLKCGRRRATQGGGGYQPIDQRWVETGEWFDVNSIALPRGNFTGVSVGRAAP